MYKIHMYLNKGSTIYEHHNLFEKLQHINIENTKPIQVAFVLSQIQRQENSQNEQEFGHTILSNLNIAMCHAFIKDQELLSPRIDVPNFLEDSKDSEDKQLVHNLHVLSEEKEKNVVKN